MHTQAPAAPSTRVTLASWIQGPARTFPISLGHKDHSAWCQSECNYGGALAAAPG